MSSLKLKLSILLSLIYLFYILNLIIGIKILVLMEAFKDLMNENFFDRLRKIILKIDNNFNYNLFLNKIYDETWKEKELKQRARHIAVCFNDTINKEYVESITYIEKIAEEAKKEERSNNNLGFLFLPEFIEAYGLEYFEESVNAIEKVTELISCEFAVRPFLIKYGDRMIEKMVYWSKSKNYHIRRLASEGCRPRLPWGIQLPEFIKNPSHILPILHNLIYDETEYVRKSVANNLNDISKDNPEIVIDFIKLYINKSEEIDKLLKHAARTMLKKADSRVYSLFGLKNEVDFTLVNFKIDKNKISKGEDLGFEFELVNKGKEKNNFRMEYAIYFLKSNGSLSRKLFKISEKLLDVNEMIKIKRKQSFKEVTTRKHYLGLHKIAIVVNGKESEKLDFYLE